MPNPKSHALVRTSHLHSTGKRRAPERWIAKRSAFNGAIRPRAAPREDAQGAPKFFSRKGKMVSAGFGKLLNSRWPGKFRDAEEAETVWNSIVDMMIDTLVSGKSITLRGLGTFKPYYKKESSCFHPAKQRMTVVSPRMHLKFTMLPILRNRLHSNPVPDNMRKAG